MDEKITIEASDTAELLKAMIPDSKSRRKIEKNINERKLVRYLSDLRCRQNLTQKQMSEKINRSQSFISKLENKKDADLTLEEIGLYAKLNNLALNISFTKKNATLVDSIKYHAVKIKEHLDELAQLASGDKDIENGVDKFLDEAFYNMTNIVLETMMKFDKYKTIEVLMKKHKLKPEKEPIRLHEHVSTVDPQLVTND